MNIEELRAKKSGLAEGESLRIAINWNNPMGSLAGWLTDIFDETFTMRTDAGEIISSIHPDQLVGPPLRTRPML